MPKFGMVQNRVTAMYLRDKVAQAFLPVQCVVNSVVTNTGRNACATLQTIIVLPLLNLF